MQPGQRHASFGAFRVSAAETTVNPFVRVKEKDHERQVVVKREQVQVGLVDARQTNPNESVREVFDAIQTNNLFVKALAVRSGDAAEDEHDRLAGLAGAVLGLPVIAQPAVPGCFLRRRSASSLCRSATNEKRRNRQREEADQGRSHENLRMGQSGGEAVGNAHSAMNPV
jgi:hypothetical protein